MSGALDKIEKRAEELSDLAWYYEPYITTGLLATAGIMTRECDDTQFFLFGCAAVYSIIRAIEGFNTIRTIKKKYAAKLKPDDIWHDVSNKSHVIWISRWRQHDQFEDGDYWHTAYSLKIHQAQVKKRLIQDIFKQHLPITLDGYSTIEIPTPAQLITAIKNELRHLEADKKALKRFTDVYRRYERPENFKPDKFRFRIFVWPNYNQASRVYYIDIVNMIGRLHVLLDIIAQIQEETGTHNWPGTSSVAWQVFT